MPEQKVALVTGCSTGVGLHTAARLAEAGWQVVATMRDTAKASALQAECTALGVSVALEPLDVDPLGRAGEAAPVHRLPAFVDFRKDVVMAASDHGTG